MTLELEKLSIERAYILQNLYPCYLHDLSEYLDILPNQHGLYEEESVTYYKQDTFLQTWWQYPGQLFPNLIKVDDRPAGFVLITTPPFISEAEYAIQEFFLLKPYRGKGYALQAAIMAFNLFHGSWKFEVLPKNIPAIHFWRRVLAEYSASNYQEAIEHTPERAMLVFRFTN
jgi:aminoglycoside 6'-N-acetyltransferase I